jgi:type II secretory pathway component GspD/PulD (secretin)
LPLVDLEEVAGEADDQAEAAETNDAQKEATTEELLEALNEAAGAESGDAASTESGAPVTITILGDELILTSSDEAALDKLEELLQNTVEAVPPRNAWTIFTLQSADATETAELLKQLFPDSSVAVSPTQSSSGMMGLMASGFSSFGSSISDMTGLSSSMMSGRLTIIPDVRLNALFVAGPPGKVQDVETMLAAVDSDNWPQSLRERVPRMIPVEHADLDEVYNIVRDVYKDFFESEQAQQTRAGANAFAAMMGGGGGRNNRQQAEPPARLTVGVDHRTSNLIVSASDELYREIQALVKSLDKSAQDARRTVRIVTVQNADPNLLTSALDSVMPKVSITSAATRTTRRSDSENQNQSGQNNEDAARRALFDRMRQGGGNSPFGGGGNPFGGGDRGRDSGGDRGGRGGDRGGRGSFGNFGGGNFGGGNFGRGFGGGGFFGGGGGDGGGRGGGRNR